MLLIIDLGSVYWQAWHSSANEPLSAAHDRAVRHVRFLREKFEHNQCAVACDSPRSFRREKHPSYKSQRPEKDKAAIEQLARVKRTLEADGLLLWECDGFEADDVIATATREANRRGYDVLIASADKDLFQLVNPAVRVFSTKTDVLYDEPTVQAKTGVKPRQMRDWLALVGDSSDNVKGVPGIGAKRAAELLTMHDNLEALMLEVARNPDGVATPAISKSLAASVDIIKTAVDLVTLRTDAPIRFDEVFEERKVKPLTDVSDAEFEDGDDANEDWPIGGATRDAVPDSERREKTETAQPADETPLPRVEVMPQRTQAITVAEPQQPAKWEHALEPRSFQAGWALAKCLYNSRLFNVASPEAAMAIIMAGRSMGLDAVTSLRGFHVVKGRPVMSAALMTGVILGSGKAKFFRLVKSTNDEAIYETWRKGDPEPVQMGFSIQDAKRAQLSFANDSNWSKYPRTMLRWRASAELARAVYPDVVMNVYVPGELDDEEAEVA